MEGLSNADERHLAANVYDLRLLITWAVGAEGRQGAVVLRVLWSSLDECLLNADNPTSAAGVAKTQGGADIDALQADGATGVAETEKLLVAHGGRQVDLN